MKLWTLHLLLLFLFYSGAHAAVPYELTKELNRICNRINAKEKGKPLKNEIQKIKLAANEAKRNFSRLHFRNKKEKLQFNSILDWIAHHGTSSFYSTKKANSEYKKKEALRLEIITIVRRNLTKRPQMKPYTATLPRGTSIGTGDPSSMPVISFNGNSSALVVKNTTQSPTFTGPRQTTSAEQTFVSIQDPLLQGKFHTGEAWQGPQELPLTSQLVWGDTVKDDLGTERTVRWKEAYNYCLGLNSNPTLRDEIHLALHSSPPRRPQRGYFLPRPEDFHQLRVSLGATFSAPLYIMPKGYIVPSWFKNLRNNWFWTSSSTSLFAKDFNGNFGFMFYDHIFSYLKVRCVRIP